MDIINASSRKRETYHVHLKYSPLWECALGIAAITNTPLLNTLEKPLGYWSTIRQTVTEGLNEQLVYVENHNTWKALLQILHTNDFTSLQAFTNYVEECEELALRMTCLPFVGMNYQDLRKKAAEQDAGAINELKKMTKDNSFFPAYIEFISKVDIYELKRHITDVMQQWYESVIMSNEKQLIKILENDFHTKIKMRNEMSSEEFVEWATGGISYVPEPSVHNVLLIPQYIYRPWNIEADLEGTKVYYYPVANESISPDDKYTPSNFLIEKCKSIGDEARLKIIKLLYEQDRTLQEITNELDLGKSTIHHHLKLLRGAKLVEISNSKYALKKKSIESLQKELDFYLKK
ncbi:ArsR/SmtB family transcription factor [Evansella cellulosilytica]|uniref:Regulatory protein ArsR n=1 Tax=Evansella cellulosilytica (strain ATCC 21833 / DSM 2522 / FERM P-1141 / JCM 9156 / N-4) TaxID=649639 RepID=E6U0Q6_EVAC2|nr:winged helix-turn-helix domain-containing protein [Evansella cellulosilytica]ADU29104.1 regulatory protein ArsR [Evansella cellulosilytica DSM 2522]